MNSTPRRSALRNITGTRHGTNVVLLTIAAASAAAVLTAQSSRTALPDKDALASSAARLKAHVAFLSDDLLEGRAAGTRGHEIAARYIAAQFALAGAKPLTANGSYLLPVPMFEVRRTGTAGTLTLSTARGTETLTHGKEVLMTTLAEGTSTVDAPLVFVGYGVKDDSLGWNDYEGLDVRGKIIVALRGTPKGIDSEIAAHLGSQTPRTAAALGAVGYIGVPTRGFAALFPWELAVQFVGDEPATTWVGRDGQPHQAARGIVISALIEQGAAAALFGGAARTLEEILAEADKPDGRPKGFALPGKATISLTTTARRYETPEVVGVIEGVHPVLKNEYVALTAHADHIGVSAAGDGDRINNGTLDNAMGTAMLIEVARALSTGQKPRRSVLLVAHTAEEKGLLGADFFAANLPVPAERVVASINLDMPMLLHDFKDVIAFGAEHSTLGADVRSAAAARGVTLSPDPTPEEGVFVRSDHYALVKAGVPSVMLAPGWANGGESAMMNFLKSHYHRPSDDMSLPIDWLAAARFADLNGGILLTIANRNEKVRWYEGDYFGTIFAPGAPKAPKASTRQR